MVAYFFLVWNDLDVAVFSKRNPSLLAQIFSRKGMEKGLEGCSLVPILDSIK